MFVNQDPAVKNGDSTEDNERAMMMSSLIRPRGCGRYYLVTAKLTG